MNTALMDPANPRYQQITDRIPAHRWGTPDDMKGICVFLASPASVISPAPSSRLTADTW